MTCAQKAFCKLHCFCCDLQWK